MNSRPTVVRISGDQRDALYSFTMDCLSGITESRPAANEVEEVRADDLRLVLDALSDTGNGPVELRILATVDARRIFHQLRQRALAERQSTSTTHLAAEACNEILTAF
jgi:hypothetical protein